LGRGGAGHQANHRADSRAPGRLGLGRAAEKEKKGGVLAVKSPASRVVDSRLRGTSRCRTRSRHARYCRRLLDRRLRSVRCQQIPLAHRRAVGKRRQGDVEADCLAAELLDVAAKVAVAGDGVARRDGDARHDLRGQLAAFDAGQAA
jgi:hypothetical protein